MSDEKGPFPFVGSYFLKSIHKRNPPNLWGWNGEDEAFEHILTKYQPNLLIEVGTWLGQSAIHMGNLRPEMKIYCVDTWLGSPEMYMRNFGIFEQSQEALNHWLGYPTAYYTFLANVNKYAKNKTQITAVPQTSHGAAMLFDYYEIKADAIYIDAGHDTDSVVQDIAIWRKNLRPGGVIFGDDYNWPSVKKAVEIHHQMHGGNLSIDGIKWIIESV